MSEEKKIEDGGPVYPYTIPYDHGKAPIAISGMTLRDYFAAKALSHVSFQVSVQECAQQCYLIADAMLEERRGRK